jgi:hypothetical protein
VHGQGDEDVEKLHFELYGTTKNYKQSALTGCTAQNGEKRIFHRFNVFSTKNAKARLQDFVGAQQILRFSAKCP